MTKIRTIKPEFWTDEELVTCSMATRLFFIGLWNFADDDGIFEWKPLSLKMKIFPADDVNCEICLRDLMKCRRIARFTHNGKEYGKILSFAKHQRIDRRFHRSTISDLTGVELHYDENTSSPRRVHDDGGGGGGGMDMDITPTNVGVSDRDEKSNSDKAEIVDPQEMEFREFIPFASKVLGHQKTFTRDALEKWRARRRKFSARDLAAAFANLRNEPDQWKIENNGHRPLSWWLKSDERIEEMQVCHLKGGGPKVAIIS